MKNHIPERRRRVIRCFLPMMAAFSFISSSLYSQNAIIDFDSDHWHLGDNAQIIQFGGRKALAGTAYVKDADVLNGTLEVDLWTTGERNFGGFMFRVQSFDEYEWCWLRTHKTNGEIQDGIQYAPTFKGVSCWQLNGGPGGMSPVNVPKNEWVHLRMELRDDTAKLYVKDMTKPAMVMDHLQLGLKKGSVGLHANSARGLYFSNFTYRVDENAKTVPPETRTAPPNVLARWLLSSSYQVPDFDAIASYPAQKLSEIKRWIVPDVDASGLVNITKYHGRTGGPPDCAILKTSIDAEQDKRVKMNFGYSDAVTIFLNRVPLFWGNSAYRSRNMAYGGWISFNDAVYLDLKRGRNELVIVTAEDFGGWGFQAKLDDIHGIEIR